jgi:hypothetical protein
MFGTDLDPAFVSQTKSTKFSVEAARQIIVTMIGLHMKASQVAEERVKCT